MNVNKFDPRGKSPDELLAEIRRLFAEAGVVLEQSDLRRAAALTEVILSSEPEEAEPEVTA